MLSMAEFSWFPHKARAIHSMARTCPPCTAKGKNLTVVSAKATTAPREPVSAPSQELVLDFWGPKASKSPSQLYILVAVDRYSRFLLALCLLVPLRTRCSASLVILLRFLGALSAFGPIRGLRSSRGTLSSFAGDTVFVKCSGTVERLIRTQAVFLSVRERSGTCRFAKRPRFNFKSSLRNILRDLRIRKHRITGQSPFFLYFGRSPNTPFSNLYDLAHPAVSYIR